MKNKENKNYKERFKKGFEILLYGRNPYEVWSDIIELFAITLQNNCTLHYKQNDMLKNVWEDRENTYLKIIKKYNKKEQKIITQMFALLVMEYEKNPNQDLLGEMYMLLGVSNSKAGQFFTPYNLCQCMSEITIDKKMIAKTVHKKGYVSINDCACGAGATLISAASQCDNLFKKLNYKNHVYFVGQDVDLRCVQMCYIQLSLLGLAGYVIHANTLTTPTVDFWKDNANIWITPYYNMDVWQGRILFHNANMLLT